MGFIVLALRKPLLQVSQFFLQVLKAEGVSVFLDVEILLVIRSLTEFLLNSCVPGQKTASDLSTES